METKENYLSLKDNKNIFVESDNQFHNLNLNQNYKCSIINDTVCSKNFTTDSKKDFSHSNELKTKNDSNSWKKFNKHSSKNFLNLNYDSEENNEYDEKEKSAINNSSTLSLHISAYENSTEAATNYSEEDSEKEVTQKKDLIKSWKTLNHHFVNSSKLMIKNPFEFPRQQKENQDSRPELMQFAAAQLLLNPNQMDPNNQCTPPPPRPVTQPLLNPNNANNSSINNQKEQQDESMPSSDAVASPPSLPPLLSTTNNIEENAIEDSIIIPTKDLNVSVKLEIYNLIQLLSNCIGDISGDKKISLEEMDEYNVELKKCLASIEVGLTEQMNIMEESLMSTDVNCCRALYDHQIEAMNEMFKEFNELIEIQRN